MNEIMKEIREIDKELYYAAYIEKNYKKRLEIWNSVKNNFAILGLSSKVLEENKKVENYSF